MSDDGFLNRWSRKKLTEPTVEEVSVAPAQIEPEGDPSEETPDAVLLEQAGLPDPDDATDDADFSEYMKAELPDRIKRRAMRRLWRSNPVLANLDGLCDYNDDFTDAALVVDNLQTVYQVGKGMVTAFLEPEETAEPDEADKTDEPNGMADADVASSDDPIDSEVEVLEMAEATEIQADTAVPLQESAPLPEPAPRLRHMQFNRTGSPNKSVRSSLG